MCFTPLWLNTLTLSFSHSFTASATFSPSRRPTSDLSTPTALPTMKGGRGVRRNEQRERGVVGGGRWEKARGRKRGRRDWFIGAEERDQGRMRGRGRMVEWSRKCVRERERRREEGQGCNWWGTWPTPPSLQWSGSVPLTMPASPPSLPPSLRSCLCLSLQFTHSVLLFCFCYLSSTRHPSIHLFTDCCLLPVGSLTLSQSCCPSSKYCWFKP